MKTVEEIQAAIGRLPLVKQRRLAYWLREHLSDAWDRQIEEDANSGRLDFLLRELQSDIDNGNDVPLDRVLDDTQL